MLLQLRVVGQGTESLLLERRDPSVELIPARVVRPARPGVRAVRPRQRHVVDARHGAPHIHERLAREAIGGGVDEPDIGRQREDDPDQAVLAKVAVVVGALAVDPEVVGIDRPEQRVVRAAIPAAPQLQEPEPRLDAGRRQLEVIRRHVTVGARTSIPDQSARLAIEERQQAANDSIAGLAIAVARALCQGDDILPGLREREYGTTGFDHQRRKHDETAGDEQESWLHRGSPQGSGCRQPWRTAPRDRRRRLPTGTTMRLAHSFRRPTGRLCVKIPAGHVTRDHATVAGLESGRRAGSRPADAAGPR